MKMDMKLFILYSVLGSVLIGTHLTDLPTRPQDQHWAQLQKIMFILGHRSSSNTAQHVQVFLSNHFLR